MMLSNYINIKELTTVDSLALSNLLSLSSFSYNKYFFPFKFDYITINNILTSKRNDFYCGIYLNDELVGFYMLRGWDSGYIKPSFGVLISERSANMGLAKLALNHAISICKCNGIKAMILKVHPENIIAKNTYINSGFTETGICENTKQIIFEKKING